MTDEDCISYELKRAIDEFIRVRDNYVALNAYCDAQEEVLSMEKERSAKMKENLEKLSQTYLLLAQRYKSTVEKLRTEKESLCKTIEDLREQCNHLQLVNIDRNGNDEQISRLENEVEVLKAQFVLQEEKHGEDVAILKQQHSDEIQRYKMLLQNAKQDTAKNLNKKKGSKSATKSKKSTSLFRWPELDVEKISSAPMADEEETGNKSEEVKQKRRKLYHEERDTCIDIV